VCNARKVSLLTFVSMKLLFRSRLEFRVKWNFDEAS
jgi:hypothetical protein